MILKEIATAGDKPLKKEVEEAGERAGSGNLLGNFIFWLRSTYRSTCFWLLQINFLCAVHIIVQK
jgi:hypothetical protein